MGCPNKGTCTYYVMALKADMFQWPKLGGASSNSLRSQMNKNQMLFLVNSQYLMILNGPTMSKHHRFRLNIGITALQMLNFGDLGILNITFKYFLEICSPHSGDLDQATSSSRRYRRALRPCWASVGAAQRVDTWGIPP